MRGFLRITASRAPYLRAGLAFPLTGDVDVRDLDGERLLELVRDPVLTVLVGDEDGAFHPAPELVGDVQPEQAQLMIDAIARDMPPRVDLSGFTPPSPDELAAIDARVAEAGFATVGDAIEALGDRGEKLTAIRTALGDAGFDSVGQALHAHAAVVAELAQLGDVDKLKADAAQLAELGDVDKLKADAALRPALENERDAAQGRVTVLERELAELKAKAPAPAPHKPKPPKAD